MSELVKTITVGEETRELGVKWENVENQPNIPDLKYQLETLEDRTAHFVYPSIPVIKFSVDSTLSAKVVRGNDSEIEILALNNETVAHNKTAVNRYSGSVSNGDFQFNAIVEVPEGKAAYIECEKTDDTHPYSNVDTVEIDATHVRVKLTKVVEDLECSIKPAEWRNVNAQIYGDYTWDEIPANKLCDMARYEFTVKSTDENAVTSVRSGDIDLTEAVKATKKDNTKKGKSTYTIAPGTATGGDVVIIVGTPAEQL